MAPTKKLSPDTAKVSTVRLTEGASVSRKVKIVFYKTVLNTCPSFLNEVKNLAKDTGINILTCVCRLAPIASQARHFPPSSGEADTKDKEFIVLSFIYVFNGYPMPDSYRSRWSGMASHCIFASLRS